MRCVCNLFEILIVLFLIATVMEYGAATLGMGYGTTLAPILLIIGYEPLMIVPVVLISQFIAGFLAAFFHNKFNNMDLKDPEERTAFNIFAVTGIIGVIASVLISLSLPSFVVEIYIALTVMIVGLLTMANGRHQTPFSKSKLLLIGGIAAFNKGMSGGGYGPVTITGQMISGIKPRAAVAITALVEGIICAVGVVLYFLIAIPIDAILLIGITTGAVAAAPFAAFTTKKLRQDFLKRIVGVSTFLIGLITLVFILLTSGI